MMPLIITSGRTFRAAVCMFGRRMLALATAGAIFAAIAGCMYLPRYIDGVPTGEPWSALPLRGWITDNGIRAEAITACFTSDCPQKVAVASLIADGTTADELARLLANPKPLLRLVATGRPRPRGPNPKPLLATSEPLQLERFSGFLMTISKPDGKGRPAHAIALGRREASELHLLLLVGENREALLHVAQQAARVK